MLDNISLFSDMDKKLMESLKRYAVVKTYAAGTLLFSEGDEGDALYIILSGKLKAIVTDQKGKEIILNVMGPGEYFGEVSLMDGQPRSATIVVKEKTRIMTITRNDFKRILAWNPDIAMDIINVLIKRLRRATLKIQNLAFKDVYGRVVSALIQLAEESDGKLMIRNRPTHSELANIIGASREMVSRVLKSLEVKGYIAVDRSTLIIEETPPASL